MLGMYIHTHWSYNHPYAARTWQYRDWRDYLTALSRLGYDCIMFWPLLDAMPVHLSFQDEAYLEKIQRGIGWVKQALGFKVYITVGANVIGNHHSERYDHEERPYFLCEWKINPKDKDQRKLFLEGRRKQLRALSNADALVVIDSDPGGYIGSTNDEFVQLAADQVSIMRETNPSLEFIYWMWCGWEAYNQFWVEAQKPRDERKEISWGGYEQILNLVERIIPEPWSVLVSWEKHFLATESSSLKQKRMFNPYGLIEGEPTFPMTNVHPKEIIRGLKPYLENPHDFPRGVMANCQTHCLQLPNTYYFAHFAQGGNESTADLERFAGQILLDCGNPVSTAWSAIEENDVEKMTKVAGFLKKRIGEPHRIGELGGLLFGDADRFLTDLIWNLKLRIAIQEFIQQFDVGNEKAKKRALFQVLPNLKGYQKRIGFVDACGGVLIEPLLSRLQTLNDRRIDVAIQDFSEFNILPRRHGCVRRLFYAMESYCRLA